MTSSNEQAPMAKFQIDHYELHVGAVEVEARSVADAIKQFLDGDGTIFNGSVYEGPCKEKGMSLTDDPGLAKELRSVGIQFREFLPAICQIRRFDNDVDQI